MIAIIPIFATFLTVCLSQNAVFTTNFLLPPFSLKEITIHNLYLPPNSSLTLLGTYQSSFNTSDSVTAFYSKQISFSNKSSVFHIWNFQAYQKVIVINLKDSSGNVANLDLNLVELGNIKSQKIFMAILAKADTQGYMLPFNLLSLKIQQIFVVEYNPQIEASYYAYEPYMATYWAESQLNSLLLPFLPFFSECTLSKKYLTLNNLLQPERCNIGFELGQQILACQDQHRQFECLTEQLQAVSQDHQFWFNSNHKNLFYLFGKPLSGEYLTTLKSNSDQVDDLVANYYFDLIPMVYSRLSSDVLIVNSYTINFMVTADQDGGLQLVSASIAGYYDATLASLKSKVAVTTNYLNFYQNFVYLNGSVFSYFLYSLFLALILTLVLLFISRNIKLNIARKVNSILAPILKGYFFSIVTGGLFLVLMYYLTVSTTFGPIVSTYDSNLSGADLALNNRGRVSLTIFVIGLFLMSNPTENTYKIGTSEDIKMFIEDSGLKVESERQKNELSHFTIKNMVSYRRYIFIVEFVNIFVMVIIYYLTSYVEYYHIVLIDMFVMPFMIKIFVAEGRKSLEFIYLHSFCVFSVIAPAFIIAKAKDIYQLTLMYFARYFCNYIAEMLVEIGTEYIGKSLYKNRQQNQIAKRLYHLFESRIQNIIKQSVYERSLYYSMLLTDKITGILLIPFFSLIMLFTMKNTGMISIIFGTYRSVLISFILYITLLCLEIVSVFILMTLLKKYLGIKIEDIIYFNHYKFQKRKNPWINDVFSQNRCINFEFREYEKFNFSYQLYFISCIKVMGMVFTGIGIIGIIQMSYIFYQDPAAFVIFISIWWTGGLLSEGIRKIVVNLRWYPIKQVEEVGNALSKTQKYLRLNDLSEYLIIDSVKEYFMIQNVDWIVANLSKIFTREELAEDNGQILNRYKHHKSIFRQKQIENRRKDRQQKQLQEFLYQKSVNTLKTQNRIIFNANTFQRLGKPLASYWLYAARQRLWLKQIIMGVKTEKKRTNCDYCSMDVELEAIQKRDFQEIINQYRVVNVGKIFISQNFKQYYRLNQQFSTVCAECKQKNFHVEKKISIKSKQSKIILKWLYAAKSNIRHRKRQKVN